MSYGVRFLGHSVHPILIVFPLGLLATALIFEIIYYVEGGGTFATVAYWMTVSGLIGGVVAALFGWIDWFAIPRDTRAKRIGLLHGVVNAATLLLFAIGLYFRYGRAADPPMISFFLALVGGILALAGGWMGGELVERLGIAVHAGAHPNAPSSLQVPPEDLEQDTNSSRTTPR